VAARLDPDNAEAVLAVLVRHALDESGQHLAIGWVWLGCYLVRRSAHNFSTC
jgi:hypothetical protein